MIQNEDCWRFKIHRLSAVHFNSTKKDPDRQPQQIAYKCSYQLLITPSTGTPQWLGNFTTLVDRDTQPVRSAFVSLHNDSILIVVGQWSAPTLRQSLRDGTSLTIDYVKRYCLWI